LGIDVYGHVGINRSEEEFIEIREGYNASISDNFRRKQKEGDLIFVKTQFANPSVPFDKEFELDLGNLKPQVLLTPGHTPQNISVHVPSCRALFSGDTIVNGYVPNLSDGDVDAWHRWMDSLNRIEQLDIDVVIPGHGEVMRGSEITREISRTRQVLEEAIKCGAAPTQNE
jgi:glyoxylase-like metal-dependent hydrolase (beta-lactamase superfamily II)